MAKTISLPGSNLHLNGSGLDKNGNKIVKLSFPSSDRAFSIQTNMALPKTHSLLHGLKTVTQIQSNVTNSELATIGKECASYIKKHGTDAQKKKLRIY